MANGIAPLGFESKLWAAADALRNNMDAAEYKHVVLLLLKSRITIPHDESGLGPIDTFRLGE